MDIETHQAVIVLADIGGYTRFIKHHYTALIHAEKIITDLLESVIDVAEHPLTLNKLEGDAALFYALADREGEAVVRSAVRQAAGFFGAFAAKRADLAVSALCTCSACQGIDQLRIKAIVHCGEVALKRVRKFQELAGTTVITAHRLLKNSVGKLEYILVTDAVERQIGGLLGSGGVPAVEECEGIGPVQTVSYDPPTAPLRAPQPLPLFRRLLMLGKMEAYVMARLIGRGGQRQFRSLAGL